MYQKVTGKHLPLLVGMHLPREWLDWLGNQQLCVEIQLVHGFRLWVLGVCQFHGGLLQQCWPDFGIRGIWQCRWALPFCS